MDGDSRGGNDTLIGGVGAGGPSLMSLYGDAFEMHDNARGGDDHLTGGTGVRTTDLYGDAGIMDGDSRGGNDTMTGGGSASTSSMATPRRCTTTPVAATTP